MAPRVYLPYTPALIEQRRRRLTALGYRPATQPAHSAVPNVPLFHYHGKYYYRPHHHMILAITASIQVQWEAFQGYLNTNPSPAIERMMPVEPPAEFIRLLRFVHRAPRSWWNGLKPYVGHVMMLQQASSADRTGGNLLRDWLLAYTMTCDDTQK